jgi:hypothetical protein
MWTSDEFLIGYKLSNLLMLRIPDKLLAKKLKNVKMCLSAFRQWRNVACLSYRHDCVLYIATNWTEDCERTELGSFENRGGFVCKRI